MPPITFTLSGHFLIGIKSTKYTFFSCRELCFAIDFLIDNIYVSGNSVLRQVVGIPMGTNSAPLLADLFLHIYEYDLLYAYNNETGYGESRVSFGNTSRYIDDLFSAETRKVLEIASVLYTLRNWN